MTTPNRTNARLRRPVPKRTGPERAFSEAFSGPSPSRRRRPPERDPVRDGVADAYGVYWDYIDQGQREAARHSARQGGPERFGNELFEIGVRALRFWPDFVGAWMQALTGQGFEPRPSREGLWPRPEPFSERGFGSSTPLGAYPGGPPPGGAFDRDPSPKTAPEGLDGFGEGRAFRHRPEPFFVTRPDAPADGRYPGDRAEKDASPRASPAASVGHTLRSISVAVRAPAHRVRVRLDLRPDGQGRELLVPSGLTLDGHPEAPRLESIRFERLHETTTLAVHVPEGQAPGRYTGIVLCARSAEGLGLLSVEIEAP